MTASVSTRGMAGARFTDSEREAMYIETLACYRRLLDRQPERRIVFAENSGWPLDKLKAVMAGYDGRVEFLSFAPGEFDNSRGKGYNEVRLMNRAITGSRFIGEAGCFFKVTGRYPVYNIGYFLRQADRKLGRGYRLYCDIKDHRLYDWLRTGWCGHSFDCRFFAMTVSEWDKAVMPDSEIIDDYKGPLLEEYLFDRLRHPGFKACRRFRREPVMGGTEGSVVDAASFSADHNSGKAKFKILSGNIIRTLTPWFWF